jgi:pseudouridine kinase
MRTVTASDCAVICVGGAVVDRTYQAVSPLADDTSNPVVGRLGYGGVARNVGENLSRLGVQVALASVTGDDATGQDLRHHAKNADINLALLSASPDARTAEYLAILEPDGRLKFGLADMAIFEQMDTGWLAGIWPSLSQADWIFADCNLPEATLADLIGRCGTHQRRLAVDGVSITKCQKLPADLSAISALFLNVDEAMALSRQTDPLSAARTLHQRGARLAVVTCGADGLIAAGRQGVQTMAAAPAACVDVTGAGDALVAAALAVFAQQGPSLDQFEKATNAALSLGLRAAALTIASPTSVSPTLSPKLFRTWLSEAPRA